MKLGIYRKIKLLLQGLQWFTHQILGPIRIPQHEKSSLIDKFFINFQDLVCTSFNFTESVIDKYKVQEIQKDKQ